MKPYKIDLDTTAFRQFLLSKGVRWEIAQDYVGIIVYLTCDTDLIQLGMDYVTRYEYPKN